LTKILKETLPISVIDQKFEAIESTHINVIKKCLKSYHTSLEEMECIDLPSERQPTTTDSVASIAASLVSGKNMVLHNIEFY